MRKRIGEKALDRERTIRRSAGIDFAGLPVHMIGIGGSGMSGAAAMLLSMGAKVSGSDAQEFDGVGRLVARGARVTIGQRAENVPPGARLAVASAAIPAGNPELVEVRSRGLTVLTYAELLGVVVGLREGVAVAGTHGKSTTTAMTAFLLREAGLDPSFVVGAHCDQLGGSSAAAGGAHFVVESCEYDRSFLRLHPASAVVLNVEPDHLDYYSGIDEIVEAFGQFCRQVRPDGLVAVNGDDACARIAASSSLANVETFGFSENVDWRAIELIERRGCYWFRVLYRGEPAFVTQLSIAGLHNVANALAAAALARHAGAPFERIADALSRFEGISRRMTLRGTGRGVTIVDDYAHHPTEIRATIKAARGRYAPRRTWVVFQPHQYERTRVFLEDFAGSFGDADEVIVPDIYSAREQNGTYGSEGSIALVARIHARGGRATYLATLEAVTAHLEAMVIEGDMVLTMGAGDIWKVADGLVERICRPD
jgi:UDP-N-acetylmuramate--alanine ligase